MPNLGGTVQNRMPNLGVTRQNRMPNLGGATQNLMLNIGLDHMEPYTKFIWDYKKS